VHEGFPLVTVPGANVFYTNEDVSTPAREDGSRLISCKQDTTARGLWQITKAGRYLARLAQTL
jgi:hypothetical protein